MIKLFKVFMHADTPEAVESVLRSGYVGEGPKTALFEEELRKLLQNDNIVVVNSGTSALFIALKCADIGFGSVVVSTPMTCLATNEAILMTGADIEWADVDPLTGLMTKATTEQAIVECIKKYGKRPDAIMTMHWGGLPVELDGINSFGIPVIEDACQALGSFYKGKIIGSKSFATCFSFQAIKTLTTIDGGMIAFKNKESEKRARLMKWFGLDRSKSMDMRCNQNPPELGYKMQLNDIMSTIGLCNLKALQLNLSLMRTNADAIQRGLIGNQCIKMSYVDYGISSNWLLTVNVSNPSEFICYMRNAGIECSKVHDRNDTKTIFERYKKDLPGVEYFDVHHVCIPCGWWLHRDEVDHIIETMNKYR